MASGSYFVGGNNAGKSAVLKAVKLFFEPGGMLLSDFNVTELRSRQAGSNRCEIEIFFDLSDLKSTNGQIREIRKFLDKNGVFSIKKVGIFREKTESIDVLYSFSLRGKHGSEQRYQELPECVQWFLSRFNVSYIHPQEAERLLFDAQEKLKRRLLSTFGRGASKYEKLSQLQKAWEALRQEANRDLSEKLTAEMRKIWPSATSQVELPEKIDDIVAISAISFKQDEQVPEVLLSAQGNGVQSAVLYQTHYLLDCDKTIHRGVHFPIWLMEEPEAFLHADIAYKLGALLVSDGWLSNIQFLATTHSPLILATSAAGDERVRWCLLEKSGVVFSKKVPELIQVDIDDISRRLGDPNFEVYFNISDKMPSILIEDARPETKDAFIAAGIAVTKQLTGAGVLKKYVDVLSGSGFALKAPVFIVLDNDRGAVDFKGFLIEERLRGTAGEYLIYEVGHRSYVILLPSNYSVEDMFEEYDSFIADIANQLFDSAADGSWRATKNSVSGGLTRAHAKVRNKQAADFQSAKVLISKEQDVKDLFWGKVVAESLKIRVDDAEAVKGLMALVQ
ncbi:MAG: ATP-binding protein [Comamonadaceae bacterium]|nr:ATP-binding protein [Comamonadaceae bacterium]